MVLWNCFIFLCILAYLAISVATEQVAATKARIRQETLNRRNHEAAQLAIQEGLSTLNLQSDNIKSKLPVLIRETERAINHAEHEYKEGVFPTFWDAVEVAANRLAEFNKGVNQIALNATNYRREPGKLEVQAPTFHIGVSTLPDATHTANRLQVIVRTAQKHPDFAKIYEMRRTNQLLVTGFSSLGEALTNLSQSIQFSLSELERSLSGQLSDLSSEMSNSSEIMTQEHEKDREHLAKIREKLEEEE